MSVVRSVNMTELEIILKNDKHVLIDFWAPWCKPCLNLMPVVEEIAAAYAEHLVVVKLNIVDYPDFAGAMEVVSIPNLQMYKLGKKVGVRVGFMAKADIESWVKECLGI